ncbi:transcriptional regulator, GntR family [Singulisphaera sp. GP187]|uniref:GntR family transcriptional regulator n=1 Tax=Singulisphaera sp. GP187 TaxID=1882752 RepID=UPI000929A0BE|nr:GntR family transcriptional regulator [Singulisphaera sp. GP187]SIO30444.1 transcriptional regulator, GntR family [Singulisphaera sp. GP187]
MSTPDGNKALKCDHGLRRRVIVQSLLVEVFQGRLRAGQHLVTQELADRFGVSPTPIREALVALEGIGIVDLLPNRGAVIRRVTMEEVGEICQVRRVLECEATRSACGWIAPADLRNLAAALKDLLAKASAPGPGFLDEAGAVDSRLHDLIASSCRNSFLAHELGRLKILFRAFRDVTYARDGSRFRSGRFEAEAHEHLAIVEALLAEDRKASVRAMSRHIRMSVENWSRTLPDVADSAPTPTPTPTPVTAEPVKARSKRRA